MNRLERLRSAIPALRPTRRLYTEVRGSGPTLVLLHGWALNLRVWDGLTAALRDRFRIVAIDLPGHGRSEWLPERASLDDQSADIHDTVSAIADRYSLLGWSLGGQIALRLAAAQQVVAAEQQGIAAKPRDTGAARAASIDRLVLIATTPRFVTSPDWPYGTPPERLAQQAAGLRTDYRRTVSDFLELQVRGSADGAAALSQLRAALFAHGFPRERPDSRQGMDGEARHKRIDAEPRHKEAEEPCLDALGRGLELLRDTDLRPLLGDITLPTLVIAGQYDRVTLPAASHALADALPNARYMEIRRAAHAPFLSHLPQLSTLLEDFLVHS